MPIPGNNLRDNLFMAPVVEGTYEQWWWQFIAEHEDWRYADSDALRKAAFEGGQESLRQQLAAALTACKVKDDALRLIKYETDIHGNNLNKPIRIEAIKALAATEPKEQGK